MGDLSAREKALAIVRRRYDAIGLPRAGILVSYTMARHDVECYNTHYSAGQKSGYEASSNQKREEKGSDK